VYDELQSRPDFQPLHEPESNILCFRYVGDGTRSDEALDQINRELRERYNLSGEGWITATNLDGRRVLRVTMMNPRTTAADVRDILDGLATIGRTL
jgi:L-2,4-diaminobutyrate decarboxylase